MNPDRAWLEEHGWTTHLSWSEDEVRSQLSGILSMTSETWVATAYRRIGMTVMQTLSWQSSSSDDVWAQIAVSARSMTP